MAVKVIKANRVARESGVAAPSRQKLKVAAYARVSTDSDEQEGSYEIQCAHYTEYINNNPDWEFAGMYADEGISGTQAKKRPEFLRMIEDCKAGKIEMVITKSISRWARNTLDSLTYIRELKALGIGVFFEKENIHTLDAKGEVLITIMSSIAQQESQSISQNVRLGIQYRMQQGKGRLNTAYFLGFTKDQENDCLAIVPEEADIVRRIYREYIEGYSPEQIARHLQADGTRTPTGNGKWHASTVRSILENEKYCGDLLLQKYYTKDVLTHEIAKNTGQFPQYYVEDAHEPIVPKEIYFQVQGEMLRRGTYKMDPTHFKFGSEKGLKSRVTCGKCGRYLRWYDNHQTWCCRKKNRVKNGDILEEKCDLRDVPGTEVTAAVITAFNRLPEMRDDLIRRQTELRSGEIKRIAALIEESKKTEASLEERRIQVSSEDGHEDEVEFLEQRIQEEEQKRRNLILERAEFVNDATQVTLLLELSEELKKQRDGWRMAMGERLETPFYPDTRPASPACYEMDDFFKRTHYTLPDVIGLGGKVIGLDDVMVSKFVEEAACLDDGIEVRFKGGVNVYVPTTEEAETREDVAC